MGTDTSEVNNLKLIFSNVNSRITHIDYVLLFEEKGGTEGALRNAFLTTIEKEGMVTQQLNHLSDSSKAFVIISTSFERLCKEAEDLYLKMPVKNCQITCKKRNRFEQFVKKHIVTDTEVHVPSAPFSLDHFCFYEGSDNKDTFFSSSLRIFLTNNILENIEVEFDGDTVGLEHRSFNLPKLQRCGIFLKAQPLHDLSVEDAYFKSQELREKSGSSLVGQHIDIMEIKPKHGLTSDSSVSSSTSENVYENHQNRFDFVNELDARQKLNGTWPKIFKFQPIRGIRNYFGELIAFYYAWCGHMTTYLWLPTCIGIIVFIYGIFASNGSSHVAAANSKSMATLTEALVALQDAFDNKITPFFAIFICVWGTITAEIWKRYRNRLAYEWNVAEFAVSQPDRPDFIGTKETLNVITGKMERYYPLTRQLLKFFASFAVLIFMIALVLAVIIAIVVYRVVITVNACPVTSKEVCLLLNGVVSSALNATAIIILGKVYGVLAYKLTDWENHRTDEDYNNALILKLFVFQFINSYTSLIYIAFFRGVNVFESSDYGLFSLGKDYVDDCGASNNCMAMLSLQVLILMLLKPLPRLFLDVVVPIAKKFLRWCRSRETNNGFVNDAQMWNVQRYLQQEVEKPNLENFLVNEYMEKVIHYGYFILFGSSFPLAPLIATMAYLIDRVVDSKRLLWLNQRPVTYIVGNIGIWESIIEFLNIVAIFVNALIVTFTSSWMKSLALTTKLIIVFAVENGVLAVIWFFKFVIPDVPRYVKLGIRRDRYLVTKMLEASRLNSRRSDAGSD